MSDLAIRIHVWMTSALVSLREERGQDLIEYALFGGLLATLIITVAGLIIAGTIDNPLESLLDGVSGCVDFVSGGCDPF
jgi:Flp pilus assembly pilin Flp